MIHTHVQQMEPVTKQKFKLLQEILKTKINI